MVQFPNKDINIVNLEGRTLANTKNQSKITIRYAPILNAYSNHYK